MIYFALALAVLAVFLIWQSARRRKQSGLPQGRVIYSDTGLWGVVEKPFYDADLGLTGKPDYVIDQKGVDIPVEVKSGYAPSEPHSSHIFQLAAYLALIERSTGKRPPYGILHYRNRTFAVDYTPELENELLDLLAEMRVQAKRGEADRSHEEAGRCARCGYRSICDQKC
jgi:CRISPR-associated exonuclease Cas4